LAVVAREAALSAVLEEIGRQSGTSITYDESAPTARMTCDFVAASPDEAFRLALEGLGVNYVLFGGTPDVPRVLLVSGSVAARVAATAPAIAPRPAEAEVSDDESAAEPPPEAAPLRGRMRHPGQAEGGDGGGRPSDNRASEAPTSSYPGAAPGHSGVNPNATGRARDTSRRQH
jgi:hypothetical protein